MNIQKFYFKNKIRHEFKMINVRIIINYFNKTNENAGSKIIYKRQQQAHTQVINFIVNVLAPKMKQFVLPTRGDEKHYLAQVY